MALLVTFGLLVAACGGGTGGAGTNTGGGTAAKPAVKVGGIFDLTGATSDVGVPYADGIKDFVAFINESGGAGGHQIQLISDDYAYQIPRA
ncbi:hypothetical protein BH18CHL2_BH18CHL2_11090 [soil metagenome]